MRVGIVGLGYVGLPLAVAFAAAGAEVVGLDADEARVAELRSGRSYIEDVSDEALATASPRLTFRVDYDALADADAILICVPTPLSANREPDLNAMLDCAQRLSSRLRAGQLVVLESTTYPGTTRERFAPVLERGGLRAGADFHLAYSPERIDPGRGDHTLANTPKLVGGLTEACGDRAQALYEMVCAEVVRTSSPEVAELSKLLENIFRAVNIALVNELALLTDRMGIDVWEVVAAAATKPYGFMRFEPGPGMGGHCLPVDPFYLAWRAREFDTSTEFIELAGKINQQMPYHCVAKLQRTLNDRGLAVRGARVAILGVSYKPGVADTRSSPALKIVELLRELGAELVYHDPHVAALAEFELRSLPLEEALEGADVVLVVTAHPGIDYAAIAASGVCVLDLRGVVPPGEAVVRL
jgi:UDP-N-acetyl-D-glucosamine dehydrogenase